MNVDYKIVDKQIILSRKLESIPLAAATRTYGTRSRIGFEPRTGNWRKCIGERNDCWYDYRY